MAWFLATLALSLQGLKPQPDAKAGAAAAYGYHVVELTHSKDVKEDMLTSVFVDKLGAEKEKVAPALKKLEEAGKAVVVAGSKDACDQAAAEFRELGMTVEVRPLVASDMPSPYDDSDVITADAAQLKDLLQEGPILLAMSATWCGHCKAMVPELKAAATALKAKGVKVVVVDTDLAPGVAQQLGVTMLPSVMWLHPVGENLAKADYQGQRDADSLVQFAEAAAKAIADRAAEPGFEPAADGKAAGAQASEAADGAAAATGSKIGKSKVGMSKVGQTAGADTAAEEKRASSKVGLEAVKQAKTPAEADAAAAEAASEAAPVAA